MAGHEVLLCARRPFAELVVELVDRQLRVPRAALTDPTAVGDPVDWILLATKTTATASAAPWVSSLRGERTKGVLVLQNGLDGGSGVRAVAAPAPVVPSIVLFGAELLAPGHVRHHGSSSLHVPAGPGDAVKALFAGTDVDVEVLDDFDTAAWRKLMLNLTGSAITTITGRRLEAFRDPAVRQLAESVLHEGVAVARAAGAALSTEEIPGILDLMASQPPTMGTSMLYDRLAGRPLEQEAITGAVVRMGAEHGVPTPVNATLLRLLQAIDSAPREP
jgi:2-dehydropantoate 2-reductase